MTRTRRIIAAAAIGAVLITGATGCSSNKDGKDTAKTQDSLAPGERSPEDQKIMDDLAKAVNVPEGQRVEPGSIKSVEVKGLSDKCQKAIQPVRDLMKKYKSGLLVPPDDPTIANVMKAANPDEKGACSYKEFADWYRDEFNGWNNAVAK